MVWYIFRKGLWLQISSLNVLNQAWKLNNNFIWWVHSDLVQLNEIINNSFRIQRYILFFQLVYHICGLMWLSSQSWNAVLTMEKSPLWWNFVVSPIWINLIKFKTCYEDRLFSYWHLQTIKMCWLVKIWDGLFWPYQVSTMAFGILSVSVIWNNKTQNTVISCPGLLNHVHE